MEDESEITLDELISRAAAGDQEAATLVIVHWWTIQLLNAVSIRAERRYHTDRDDVRQIVHLALFLNITKLKNPRNRTWRQCLKYFCCSTAKNHCLNNLNHYKVVTKHEETELSELRPVQRKSTKSPSFVSAFSTTTTPEEQYLKKERAAHVQAAAEKVRKRHPRHAAILDRWLEGNEVKEIAEAIGKSVKTVYPKLKTLQGELFREVGEPFKAKTHKVHTD